jgi:hypothetical protein
MNFLNEMTALSVKIDRLYAARLDAERSHKRLSNSIALANLSRTERDSAPVERGRLIAKIAAIDAEVAKITETNRALNLQRIAASRTKAALPESGDVKLAAKLIGNLETKREVLQETIARLENDRRAILLSAVSGDTKSKAEASRLAGQIAQAIADANDLEAGLSEARKNLLSAQAEAAAKDSARRSEDGKKIGNEAVADAAEFDRLMIRAVEILDHRSARTDQLVKLGAIDHTRANRIRGQRVILGALIRAGLKRHIRDLNSISGSAWLAETDRVLFPTIERAPAKAA